VRSSLQAMVLARPCRYSLIRGTSSPSGETADRAITDRQNENPSVGATGIRCLLGTYGICQKSNGYCEPTSVQPPFALSVERDSSGYPKWRFPERGLRPLP
jgi:hypothetical protein